MMTKVLIVIDMQNDFVTGSLGTPEAVAIVPRVVDKIRGFDGLVLFTRDTHRPDYLNTQEGQNLPVPHCFAGSEGWMLCPEIDTLRHDGNLGVFDKPGFGSVSLAEYLLSLAQKTELSSIELVGVCTDICVISNALLIKAFLPEIPVSVDASCCAGVSPEGHRIALSAMAACQIQITN